MAKVVIFGLQENSELAHYYLTHDSEHEVVAFSVDGSHMPERLEFCGLPICSFEKIDQFWPPKTNRFFAPLAASRMNTLREQVFKKIRQKGYSFVSYVSSRATVFDNQIGQNCFILENNTLQPFTEIGDNCVLWSGNHIGHHGYIGNHVTITSQVVLSGRCKVQDKAFIGVNATVRDGLNIGEGALIGMGAVMTKDADPWGVYQGNPAKKLVKRSDEIDF